jgi:hypothetical protein
VTGREVHDDRERAIVECLVRGEFYRIHGVSGDLWDEVPVILRRIWDSGKITVEQRRCALRWVWINNKTPVKFESGPGLGSAEWVQLFQTTGYLSYIEPAALADGNRADLPYPLPPGLRTQPTRELVIWRGASTARQRGMSWTHYRQCAEDFARVAAEDDDAALFRAIIPGRAVLAAFADGREQEIVVNPCLLPHALEVVERVPTTSAT